jgi:TP53 regulating kinase and related kinases
MEYIDGVKLKDYINDATISEASLKEVLVQMGEMILKVHEIGVIHGDLTTSNMVMKENKIFLIDFGLSYFKDSA